MPDDLATQYQARQPMLQHVADSLRAEISDLLSDAGMPARIFFAVATSDAFLSRVNRSGSVYQSPLTEIEDQVVGAIEVREFSQVSDAESKLREILTVHSTRWVSADNHRSPCLQLTCVIPPQAMPEGWRSRSDVPSLFQLNVAIPDRPPQEPVVLPLPAVNPNLPLALIMKGGGIKGLAYIGALEVLTARYNFNWFVGTSAGAITAILLGAGYSPQELRELLQQKDFRDFFDASWYAKPFNLLFHHGLHRAVAFTDWLDDLLAKKLGSPTRVKLSQLPQRVTVYASRRGKQTMRFDSRDNDADAAYAARCSMSIPWVFMPEAHQGINTYDGGIHQNYPVEQLLRDHPGTPFISLFLGPETYEPVRQRCVLLDLLSIWTEGSEAEILTTYRAQTVIIDVRPVATLDFELSDEEKTYLLACGRVGALTHLSNGSSDHAAAKTTRDELKVKVLTARKTRRRKKWTRRVLAMLGAVGIYALYWYFW
jgi:predicted acylesterase/phospholipase RssA